MHFVEIFRPWREELRQDPKVEFVYECVSRFKQFLYIPELVGSCIKTLFGWDQKA